MSSPTSAKRANDAASPGSKEPGAKRLKPSYSKHIIRVLVDANEEEFVVHEDIVRTKSPFFKAACKEYWPEGKEGVVKLPEHPAHVFKLFAHWMYSNTIDIDIIDTRAVGGRMACLADAWILGDFLGCFEFCNTVADSAIQGMGRHRCAMPHWESVKKVALDSHYGRLLVDHMAFHGSASYSEKYGPFYPMEFNLEVMKVLYSRKTRTNFNPLEQDRCYYHEHPEGTPKCT